MSVTLVETYPTPANGMLPLILLSLTEHRMSWTKGRSVAPPAVPPVAVYLLKACRRIIEESRDFKAKQSLN